VKRVLIRCDSRSSGLHAEYLNAHRTDRRQKSLLLHVHPKV